MEEFNKHQRSLIDAAIAAAFAVADQGINIAGAVQAALAGVSPAKQAGVVKAIYDGIRAVDGVGPDGKLRTAITLSDRTARAYGAARAEVKRLRAKGKGKGKGKGPNKRKGKAIVIPLDRKGISAMVKAAVATIQKAESLPYDAAVALAAWQALDAVCGIQKKQK